MPRDHRATMAYVTADLTRFGLAVGHATDEVGGTGVTVIRGIEAPHRASVAVLGRATGSRELALLEPGHLVDRVDAILLCGGSAYGLDAAAGVMRWMERAGRGFSVPGGVVPIVPAAVLFDLSPCGRFDARPTPAMAESACDTAVATGIAEGSVGAGTGLTVGKLLGRGSAMKGGIGLHVVDEGEVAAMALVAVNAFGDVRDAHGSIIAGARTAAGAFVDTERRLASGTDGRGFTPNTTLAVVAIDAAFDKLALHGIARAAGAALHRRIAPAGTSVDGDIIFALAPMTGPSCSVGRAEALVVAALEGAIERAVRLARGRDGIPGLAD